MPVNLDLWVCMKCGFVSPRHPMTKPEEVECKHHSCRWLKAMRKATILCVHDWGGTNGDHQCVKCNAWIPGYTTHKELPKISYTIIDTQEVISA